MVLVEEIIKNEISECKLCGENGYLLVNKKEGRGQGRNVENNPIISSKGPILIILEMTKY